MEMREIPQHLPETVSLLDRLRMAIYRGELRPGQRLVETELAGRYETSRGAVREALVLLGNEGLVSRERNRGATVRPVSLEEAIEITETRAVLEGLCAAKAAVAVTRAEARELKAVGKKMSDAVKHGDAVSYQFHVSLLPGRMAQGLKEHLAIIDAVTSGDPEVAERTMREHLLSVIRALHQLAELGASPMAMAGAWS